MIMFNKTRKCPKGQIYTDLILDHFLCSRLSENSVATSTFIFPTSWLRDCTGVGPMGRPCHVQAETHREKRHVLPTQHTRVGNELPTSVVLQSRGVEHHERPTIHKPPRALTLPVHARPLQATGYGPQTSLQNVHTGGLSQQHPPQMEMKSDRGWRHSQHLNSSSTDVDRDEGSP